MNLRGCGGHKKSWKGRWRDINNVIITLMYEIIKKLSKINDEHVNKNVIKNKN